MPVAAVACVIAVLAWAYLLAGHGGYWRAGQRLPPAAGDPPAWPDVVAVIPARNEAAVLPATLPTLLAQDYPGALGVLLVDDQSSDGTAEVAEVLARGTSGRPARGRGHRVRRTGWAGKVWAMEQGRRAAGRAAYLLFTDADIAYRPGTVTALVRAAEADDRALVSQMALLRADTLLGAPAGARVRVLLRPALPVPPGQPAGRAHGRGRRRVHARARGRSWRPRAASAPSAAPGSTTWPSAVC